MKIRNCCVERLAVYRDTHRTRRTCNHAYSTFHGGAIQIGHLNLGDFLKLGRRNLAHLNLVRCRRTTADAGCLQEQYRRRWRLDFEREGLVAVKRDHHRQDRSLLLGRLGVELLDEFHTGQTTLTECRTYRRCHRGLSSLELELEQAHYFFCHCATLPKVIGSRYDRRPTVGRLPTPVNDFLVQLGGSPIRSAFCAQEFQLLPSTSASQYLLPSPCPRSLQRGPRLP